MIARLMDRLMAGVKLALLGVMPDAGRASPSAQVSALSFRFCDQLPRDMWRDELPLLAVPPAVE